MSRKIIFLDIDGTLTEPGCNEVPESAVWAVRQARRQGHYVYLCTGRNYGMLSPLLKYQFDGIISSAGAYIKCRESVIYDCPMTQEQRKHVLHVLQKYGISHMAECRECVYEDDGMKTFMHRNAEQEDESELLRWRRQLEKNLHIHSMETYQGQPIYKVAVMSTQMKVLIRAYEDLKEDFDFHIRRRDRRGLIYGEVIGKSFDKGKAVERVCRHLNVPLCDTIAIGDSLNDLEMIRTAGFSICMRNGSDKLKDIVDDICPSVNEDGIKYAFLKHLLILDREKAEVSFV